MPIPTVDTGAVDLRAHCPGCGATGVIRVRLGVRLERTAEDDPGTVRATLKHTPITHDCRVRDWPAPDGTDPDQYALPELES